MKHLVFCYGTLKLGFYWHDKFLGNGKSTFIGPAVTSKDYTLYVEALPVVIKERGDLGAKGEVYEVNDEVLKSLDDLESHPEFYKRELIEVTTSEGETLTAWCYMRSKHFAGKNHSFITDEFV